MTPELAHLATWGLLAGAGFVAGGVNAVAGGGTLLAFPALLASGLPALAANATCSAALAPASLASAWGYREEVRETSGLIRRLAPFAAAGGALGAGLLLVTPARVFDAVVPLLVGGATALLVRPARRPADAESSPAAPAGEPAPGAGARLAELLVGVYGGYFGAGIGILMLALWDRLGLRSLHHANAAKTVLAGIINVVAAIVLAARGAIDPPRALAVGLGAVLGGYAGARVARRVAAARVRWAVVGVGVTLTVVLAAKLVAGHVTNSVAPATHPHASRPAIDRADRPLPARLRVHSAAPAPRAG